LDNVISILLPKATVSPFTMAAGHLAGFVFAIHTVEAGIAIGMDAVLGKDQDGEIVTSCRVEPAEVLPAGRRGKGLSGDNKAILEALEIYVAERGEPNPGGVGYLSPSRLCCLRAVSSQGIRFSIFSTKTVHHNLMISLNNF
jgi:hypothetical protein